MLWEKVADNIYRRPKAVLAIVLIITFFFLYALRDFRFDTDQASFLDAKYTRPQRQIEGLFDQHRMQMMTLEGEGNRSVLSLPLLKEQHLLLQAIEKRFDVDTESIVEVIGNQLRRANEGTGRADWTVLDYGDFDEIGHILFAAYSDDPYEFERSSRRALSDQRLVDRFQELEVMRSLSGDDLPLENMRFKAPYVRATRVAIRLRQNLLPEEAKEVFSAIRDFTDGYPSNLAARHFSSELMEVDIDRKMESRIYPIVAFTSAMLVGILWLLFRKPSFVLLPLLEVIISLIWTFGTAVLLDFKITFTHLIILPLILGYGVDDDVYFSERFLDASARLKDRRMVLREVLRKAGTAIFLASFTTAIAFLASGLSTTLVPITSYCLLAAAGIMYSFILTILVNSSVRALQTGRYEAAPELKMFSRLGGWVFSFLKRHGTAVLVIVGVLAILAAVSAKDIDKEFRATSFLAKDMPTHAAHEFEQDVFTAYFPHYVLVEGEVDNPDVLQKVARLEDRMADYTYLERIHNRANIESMRYLQAKFRPEAFVGKSVEESFDHLLASDAVINPIMNVTAAEQARRVLHRGNGHDATLITFWMNLSGSSTIRATYDQLRQDIDDMDFSGVRVTPAGEYFSGTLTAEDYTRTGAIAFFVALLVTLAVLWLVFRDITYTLIAVLPIVIATVLTLGLMPMLGIKLTALTVEISALTIGLGIDFGIHLLHRYKEEREHHGKEEALERTIQHTGVPMGFSAFTTILAFTIFAVTLFPITRGFGILVGISIFLTFMTSLLVIPVLLLRKG